MKTVDKRLEMAPKVGGVAYADDDREAEINPDFARAIVVDTHQLSWQPTPEPGVFRKRLELIGQHQPRLTTLVRFAPGSRFESHGHDGGEEFLVLSGTFSDHSGNFSAGTYVRNPSGWVHAPWTEQGCQLFVKLRQFQTDDKERVIVSTRKLNWQATANPNLLKLALHAHRDETVVLYQLVADARAVSMDYPGGAEILLLNGGFEDETGSYTEGAWIRLPAGSQQRFNSERGCRFYCKTGRLSR